VGNLEVVVFEGEDLLAAVDAVRALGANVIRSGGQRIIVYADLALVPQIAAIPQVRAVNPFLPFQLANNVAVGIIHADTLHTPHGLDGSDQIVGVADTGLDTGTNDATMHDDFEGRIVSIYALGRPGDASDIHNHGTHVAGSVLGDGSTSNGQIQGMAPAARVVFQSLMDSGRELGGIPVDLGVGLFDVARDDGAHVHTNSWGANVEGAYTTDSDSADVFAFNNREFLILFSAGNWRRNMWGTWLTGVGSPGTAKNVLTVGASESVRPLPGTVHIPGEPPRTDIDDVADDQGDVAWFSCVGPAQNNRQKPDVVAPGTWILSTRSSVSVADTDEDSTWTHPEAVGLGLPGEPIFGLATEDAPDAPPGSGPDVTENYYFSNGTSMATPLTAGSCALLRQYLTEQRGHTPSAALLKALIINGAVDLGMGIPDTGQGWGRVDLTNMLFPPGTNRVQYDDTLANAVATGDVRSYDVWVSSAAAPLVVTLVWRDPAGSTIQNRLHLRVIHVDSGAEVVSDPIANIRNNVQKVVIDPPIVGQYRIEVEGVSVMTGVPDLTGLRQDYALVVANAIGFSCNPSDIVQVIDRSGSMGFSGYMEPAKERAKQMIDILQINDQAGIVTFDASAVEDMALTTIDSQADKNDAHALITPITSGGMTDLRGALEQGLTTLGADTGRPRAMVFLSDGYHTVATPEIDDPFLDTIEAADVDVYTIALGPASDFGVLNNIASRTGTGSVYTVESAADLHKLHEIYYDIVGGIGCGSVTHLTSAALPASQALRQFAPIAQTAREAFFAASWPRVDAEIEFALESPSGKTYDPGTDEALYLRGSTHAFYRVSYPEAGAWKLIVQREGGGGDEPLWVTTAAMADTEAVCKVRLDPEYLYDGKVLLRLSAHHDGRPLVGGKAIARITFPTRSIDALLELYADELKEMQLDKEKLAGDADDETLIKLGMLAARYGLEGKDIYEREQVKLQIRDDGQEEDPKANDGIYTAFFDPIQAGVAGNYQIKVFFTVEDEKLGTYACTKLIPVHVPRARKPEAKLVIEDIFVRRNKDWGYTIIGAHVVHPDGKPASPKDGVTVNMILTQGLQRIRSGDLPYYRDGEYPIWRFDWEEAGVKPGEAMLTVQASVDGLLTAQASQAIQL
jgi:subtilisin family serine protease